MANVNDGFGKLRRRVPLSILGDSVAWTCMWRRTYLGDISDGSDMRPKGGGCLCCLSRFCRRMALLPSSRSRSLSPAGRHDDDLEVVSGNNHRLSPRIASPRPLSEANMSVGFPKRRGSPILVLEWPGRGVGRTVPGKVGLPAHGRPRPGRRLHRSLVGNARADPRRCQWRGPPAGARIPCRPGSRHDGDRFLI